MCGAPQPPPACLPCPAGVACDVSDPASVDALMAAAQEKLGGIDVLGALCTLAALPAGFPAHRPDCPGTAAAVEHTLLACKPPWVPVPGFCSFWQSARRCAWPDN